MKANCDHDIWSIWGETMYGMVIFQCDLCKLQVVGRNKLANLGKRSLWGADES